MSGKFSQLRQHITSGDVLLPGDEGYEESLKRWSKSAEKPAGVVVKVTSPEEVSAAVKFATAQNIPLTVRGGGHSTSGTSSSDGGMVIDLSRMRKVTVDKTAGTVSFEGGCVFADVDDALAAEGLATVGGLYNQTGVGGLILGGGHGFLTARHGLSIDNLLSVSMVLADGSIVEVNENHKPDLFWGVRGAGAQLGIATKFTSRAYPQGDVWGGPLVFGLDKVPELVSFANEFHERNVPDHNLILAFGCAPEDYTTPVVLVGVFYNGPKKEGEEFFAPLIALGPLVNLTGTMPYPATNTLFNSRLEGPSRWLMGSCSVSMPLKAESIAEAGRRFLDFIMSHSGMEKSVLVFEFFPTGAIRATPHDATAFASRGEHYLAVIVLGYGAASQQTEVHNFKGHLSHYLQTTCGQHGRRAAGELAPFYVNLEHESLRPEDAFGSHVERIRELKHKYDPGNVFHKWHGVVNHKS